MNHQWLFYFLNLSEEEGLAEPWAILLTLTIPSLVFSSSALQYNTSGIIPYLPYVSPVSLQNKALLKKG